jgi:hypothetical protein
LPRTSSRPTWTSPPPAPIPSRSARRCQDQRLKRYFTRVGEQLRIRPELRKTVIFARHNMISDAPFTKVDLVSCRNTLIYFESELQEVVLKRFQYALGVNGVLFLGSSESLGRLQRDFTVLNSSARIFRALRPAVLSLEALQTAHKPAEARMRRSLMRGDTGVHNPVELAQKTLVEDGGTGGPAADAHARDHARIRRRQRLHEAAPGRGHPRCIAHARCHRRLGAARDAQAP